MRRLGAVVVMVICLAAGFAAGFKTALAREHGRLEHHKQILKRVHSEVWSNPDLNAAMKAADELYTPDFVVHNGAGDERGLDTLKKGLVENRSISPDWNEEVLDMVAEGDNVVSRFLSLRSGVKTLGGFEFPPYLTLFFSDFAC